MMIIHDLIESYQDTRWPLLQGKSIRLYSDIKDFDLGKKKNFSIFGVEVKDWPQLPVVPGTVGEYSSHLNTSSLARIAALDPFTLVNKLPKPWPTFCGHSISTRRISLPKVQVTPLSSLFTYTTETVTKPKRKRAPRKKKVKTNG